MIDIREVATFLMAGWLTAPAVADVTEINDVLIDARNFDDYPDSTLVIEEDFPSLIRVEESAFGSGGFANRHRLFYTSDALSRYQFDNQTAFDISMRIRLDGGTEDGKEAGFYFDKFGEPRFIIKGNGEVAAFDGAFPFFSFGFVYVPGSTVTMRMVYTPGSGGDFVVPATIEYFYEGVGSGPIAFGNLENGMIDGTVGGFYAQFAPDDGNPDDFGSVEIRDVRIAVPTPGTAIGLSLLGLRAGRRRRFRTPSARA
ncbi:MAG: hypothetical protein H6811_10755 [Phycisphaeraceae bacterium]|nr:hypothetical protein [Phycisphaeraceae bacterium]